MACVSLHGLHVFNVKLSCIDTIIDACPLPGIFEMLLLSAYMTVTYTVRSDRIALRLAQQALPQDHDHMSVRQRKRTRYSFSWTDGERKPS